MAKANNNDIANLFEYAKSINLPDNHIFFKILSGQGSIFNGKNRVFLESKAVRSGLGKHILELGYATRGGVYIQEFIDNFEKAFNGKRHFNKKSMEGFYVYSEPDGKPLYTLRTYEKNGKEYFKSFYGHERGEKETKKIVAGLRTSHRLLSNLVLINPQQSHNISQNPEKSSGNQENLRFSIAPVIEIEKQYQTPKALMMTQGLNFIRNLKKNSSSHMKMLKVLSVRLMMQPFNNVINQIILFFVAFFAKFVLLSLNICKSVIF